MKTFSQQDIVTILVLLTFPAVQTSGWKFKMSLQSLHYE